MYQLSSGAAPRPILADATIDHDWSRLWRALSHRRRVFLWVTLGAFAVIAAYTLFAPKTYTTHVKLIVGNGSSSSDGTHVGNTTLPILNALLAASGIQTSETYAELFRETPVARQVIDQLHLTMTPEQLLAHVKVTPVVNTTLLDLAVSWNDRDMSATVANAFASAFVDRERQLVGSQADAAIKTLSVQVPPARARAIASAAALARFQSQNQLADLQTQTQNTMNAASTLDAKIQSTKVDQQQAAAQLASVTGQLHDMESTVNGPSSTAPNPVLQQLQQQLAQVNVQLQVAEQQYTDAHPTVIGLKRQQAELRQQIARTPATIVSQANTMPNPVYQQLSQQAATAEAQIASDTAILAQLRTQQAAMQPQLRALPVKATQLLELQRQAKLNQDVLDALQQKLNEANISKQTALSDVTITAPARASEATSKPNRALNLAIGALASVVLGAIVALLLFVFDRRIRDERQIEEHLELPVLASIPMLEDLSRQFPLRNAPALPPAAPKTESDAWKRAYAVESFLQLVTALRYSTTADKRHRCITVTSPAQGDGKSTIALNTAVTMAHIEPRVLLIDGDLRRPSLHSKLNRDLGRGLSDVLVGTAQLDDCIMPTEHDGLDLMTSGTRTPNSVKLIQSTRFDEVLDQLLERYQTVIIDAPALGPVIDAAILAMKADATLMVISIDSTNSGEVQRAIAKLQQVGINNIVGTVANRTKPTGHVSYDDYFFIERPEQAALPSA